MTDDERTLFRATLGTAILGVQAEYRDERKMTPEEYIPEMIAALVSFAAFVSKENAGITHEQFLGICLETARNEYGSWKFK